MLPLNTFAQLRGSVPAHPVKVLGIEESLGTSLPRSQVAVRLTSDDPVVSGDALREAGFAAVVLERLPRDEPALPVIHSLRDADVVAPGDVIRVRQNGQVSVLFRRGANANSLFVTERCNSKCLMCSQPPRDEDDSWLVDEILSYIPLIDRDLDYLGVTGGEATLLDRRLVELIERCRTHLPTTHLHILTNGRRFGEASFADLFGVAKDCVTWAIPLYGPTNYLHDYVVQAAGAFDETINGIYNLAERGHAIEIRVVLSATTLPYLQLLSEFIYRNLPFVRHVALMGLEPMGYAKVNRDLLWIDPADYGPDVARAAAHLHDRGITTSIYNVQLCALPRSIWHLARKSISDWKNMYVHDCDACSVRDQCCGFFASAGSQWRSRAVRPIGDNP